MILYSIFYKRNDMIVTYCMHTLKNILHMKEENENTQPIYLTAKHKERSEKAMASMKSIDPKSYTLEDMLKQLRETTP